MILNPTAALDFRCRGCHAFVRYFEPPRMCPTGCGSREFERADPREAQRDRERAKTNARDITTTIFH